MPNVLGYFRFHPTGKQVTGQFQIGVGKQQLKVGRFFRIDAPPPENPAIVRAQQGVEAADMVIERLQAFQAAFPDGIEQLPGSPDGIAMGKPGRFPLPAFIEGEQILGFDHGVAAEEDFPRGIQDRELTLQNRLGGFPFHQCEDPGSDCWGRGRMD
jgi:hypothetical protein